MGEFLKVPISSLVLVFDPAVGGFGCFAEQSEPHTDPKYCKYLFIFGLNLRFKIKTESPPPPILINAKSRTSEGFQRELYKQRWSVCFLALCAKTNQPLMVSV